MSNKIHLFHNRKRFKQNSILFALLLLFVSPFGFALNYGVAISNEGLSSLNNVPVTFGQPFLEGDIPAGKTLTGKFRGESNNIDIQVDVKARHPDGSIRHAIISLVVPQLSIGQVKILDLSEASAGGASSPAVALSAIDDLNVSAELNLSGQLYTASLADTKSSPVSTWLNGSVVSEWIYKAPLKASNGSEHSHLAVYFHVRKYANTDNVKIDAVVENNWTFQAGIQDFNYNVDLKVNGSSKYSFDNLIHYSNARWKQTIWSQSEPEVHVAHDAVVLMKTKAVPAYDPQLLSSIKTSRYQGINYDEKVSRTGGSTAKYAPMGVGLVNEYMPMTGGRREIGPLPDWVAAYIISQTPDTKKLLLKMGDTAGSWGMHYRDKNTGLPISIADYPLFSTHFNSKVLVPIKCSGSCNTPYSPDDAHEPSLAYVPYLVTGDYFYLEELMFWTTFNIVKTPEGTDYRDAEKGLFYGQIRAISWSLRTLAQTAYILPDDHEMKAYFTNILINNINKQKGFYLNPEANPYGAIKPYGDVNLSGWQDDFYTWAISQMVDMGFSEATDLANWKARFSVQRMGYGVEGNPWCWVYAAPYQIKDVYNGSFSKDISTLWAVNNPGFSGDCATTEYFDAAGLRFGEMTGYGDNPQGYPAIMRAALAAAVDRGATDAQTAWNTFYTREVKPDYTDYANWALVPRSLLKSYNTTLPDAGLAPEVPSGVNMKEVTKQ